jgi:hypothetical protein
MTPPLRFGLPLTANGLGRSRCPASWTRALAPARGDSHIAPGDAIAGTFRCAGAVRNMAGPPATTPEPVDAPDREALHLGGTGPIQALGIEEARAEGGRSPHAAVVGAQVAAPDDDPFDPEIERRAEEVADADGGRAAGVSGVPWTERACARSWRIAAAAGAKAAAQIRARGSRRRW